MELKSSEEKAQILRDDFNIELSRDMKEELEKMRGLMQPLLDIAAEQAAMESEKNQSLKIFATWWKI